MSSSSPPPPPLMVLPGPPSPPLPPTPPFCFGLPMCSPPPPPPPESDSSLQRSPPPPLAGVAPRRRVVVVVVVAVASGVGVLILVVVLGLVKFYTKKKEKRKGHWMESNGYGATPIDYNNGGQTRNSQKESHPPTVDHKLSKPSSSPSMPSSSHSEAPPKPLGFSISSFTYEELAKATDGFSKTNLLGQGGFGCVYKGILPTGEEVAVKSMKNGGVQGELEFHTEVETISRVHHKHLVTLLGYCIAGSERMLVYEFVTNGTLEFHLHGEDQPTMNWETRMTIAIAAAKGLAYLHEDCHPKIIHRDIKAANILLDFNFDAKVSDFGLAKFSSDQNTHVSTRVMGTFGYLAPEYASTGKLTEKSDVFSFGVMLLELITGRRPIDTMSSHTMDGLVDSARPFLSQALENEDFDSLANTRLLGSYNHSEMARMVTCAAACVQHSARSRPKMSQIVRALEGNGSLDDISRGIVLGHSTTSGYYGGSGYEGIHCDADMKKFREMVLESQELGNGKQVSCS